MHNPDLDLSTQQETQQIQAEQVGQRFDRYLVATLEGISRSQVQQLIADGGVLINGRVSKPGYLLRKRDEIQFLRTTPETSLKAVTPQPIPLDVLYEDAYLLIINKAAGMVVHPAPGHYDDTLVNALLARNPELQAMAGDMRPGIVHRLDQDTSGLLIVAKDIRTQTALIEQMKAHEVVKRYLALVEGVVALDRGTIDAPIGRNPRHRQQMAITTVEGREARTHFRTLKRFARHTFLQLELETGRTHQIRVHLQAIKYPVAGDTVYGSGNGQPIPSLQRQFLHAWQLEFLHPITGQQMTFETPLPSDLQTILEEESAL